MATDNNLTSKRDDRSEHDQERDAENAYRERINISACLEARSLYDAAYHRDRGDAVVPPPKPQVVSLWNYVRAVGTKVGTAVLGRGLQLTMLIAGALIVTSGVQDVSEYQRAQPVIHIGTPPEKRWTGQDWLVGYGSEERVVNGEFVVNADGPGTWSEVSAYKLPADWAKTNVAYYVPLLGALFLSGIGARLCLKGSRKIKTGIPIQYADTAHLSAQESLVRASQQPAGENLVRWASCPDASPDTLLRPVGSTHGTPPEQLVRAVAGREQD